MAPTTLFHFQLCEKQALSDLQHAHSKAPDYNELATQWHLHIPYDDYGQHDECALGDDIEHSKVIPERDLYGSQKLNYIRRIGP